MADPTIPLSDHAARRRRLRTALKKSVAIVFAGEHDAHLPTYYRPHPHFEYLTGLVNEPGAILVLDPGAPTEARRDLLFLRPLNPELEKWDGYRTEVSQALRDETGFKAVFRTTHFPRFLNDAVRRTPSLACVHALAAYDQPVSPDLEIFRKLQERIPGVEIRDATDEMARLRSVKSPAEVAMIQRAADITAAGFAAVMRSTRPGQSEFDLQETLEHAYRTNGSRGPAFGTIAGSGLNSTVLHYKDNDAVVKDGDLICLDSGAAFGGYGADVTRTIPANGRFTDRQAEIYSIVLRAMNAAIKAVKPGVPIAKIDQVARAIIIKAGYGDSFIHGIGHHLGLETHDVSPEGDLKEGAVITIEPGIYLPDEALGVRIEDDVVVTRTGCRNLTAKIPKSVQAIEKAMAEGRTTRGKSARRT